jgi:hypothetical protein
MARVTRHLTPPERQPIVSQHQADLARKHGLSIEQIEDLMHQYGHEEARLDAAVRRLPD